MHTSVSTRSRAVAVSLVLALVAAWLLVAPGVEAHPGLHPKAKAEVAGILVQVNGPAELAADLPAVQWGDTGPVDGQTADLVYAGTGCSPASYAPIADQVAGKIALIEPGGTGTTPLDVCPASTFAQRVQSAQQAGAIGLVSIPSEGAEPNGNATAVAADIPGLEVHRTPEILAVRDAVIAGTAVNVTLADTREPLAAQSDVPCLDGMAGDFECDGIDLLSFVPREDFNGGDISDLWGWTDPDTGDEYVIIGKTNGVAFFRVTDPIAPEYLGELPNPGLVQEVWHDVKVYENHAFIVSESAPHGMGVFDLTRLREITEAQQWDRDATYPLNFSAHNIAINEDTGFAYIVGGNAGIVGPDQCLSGLHMVDIREPKNPTFAGCYVDEGGPGTAARSVGPEAEAVSPAAYVHDTQCVIYDGPDERYTGREICLNAAENKIVIVDVTDKASPVTVGVTDYANVTYAHQGWLTEDHSYFIANDELDETTHGTKTRSIVFDVTDLENPTLHFEHFHETESIDHNAYVKDGLVYQSNYTSGLRVLDAAAIGDPADPRLEQLAFFDVYPSSNGPTFDGTWSNFPYFDSGTIAVSGIGEGLFLLRLADAGGDDDAPTPAVEVTCTDCPVQVRAGESGTATVAVRNIGNVDDTYTITVEGVSEGDSVTIDPDSISLAPGESGEVVVTITVPKNTKAGTYTFTVVATSSVDPEVSGSDDVQVDVRKGRPSDPGRPSGQLHI